MNCVQEDKYWMEEDDDKTDDSRYYYFGIYIKVYMCDICNGFLD